METQPLRLPVGTTLHASGSAVSHGRRVSILVQMVMCVATLLFLDLLPLSSQTIERQWKVTLPYDARQLTYSADCTRFAYMEFSAIVRGDATTGAIIDRVSPHSEPRLIVHCGKRLYLLMAVSPDELRLGFLDETSRKVVETAVVFKNSDSIRYSNAMMFVIGDQQTLILHFIVKKPQPDNSKWATSGLWIAVDPLRNSITDTWPGQLDAINISADGRSCVTEETETEGNTWYRPTAWVEYSLTDFVELNRCSTSGRSGSSPISLGCPGLVLVDSTIYNLKSGREFGPDTSDRGLLCNLAPEGWMLGVKVTPQGRIIGVRDVIHGAWTTMDTLTGNSQSDIAASANSIHHAVFVFDTKNRSLQRYSVTNLPRRTLSVVKSAVDTILNYSVTQCYLRTFESTQPTYVRWYFGDSQFHSQSGYNTVFSPKSIGANHLRADILDSSGVVLLTAMSDSVLVVKRPDDIQMSFQNNYAPVWSMSVQPGSKHLAIIQSNLASIVSLPDILTDQLAPQIRAFTGGGAIAFDDSADSFIRYETNVDESSMHHAWYRASMSTHDSTILHSQTASHGNLYFESGGKLMYNHVTNRLLAFTQVFNHWWAYEKPASILELPTQLGMVQHLKNVSETLVDADAGMEQYLVLTYTDHVSLFDLQTGQEVRAYDFSADQQVRSAMLVKHATIVTTRGILTADQKWSLKYQFRFEDGIAVVRLPDPHYSFILRDNADTMGHIISTTTGEVVFTIHQGFARPSCAVYDPIRNAIHIGDQRGIVSTCPIPELYSTRVAMSTSAASSQLRFAPNPTDDTFSIDIESDDLLGESDIKVMNTAGMVIAPRQLGSNTFSLGACASGIYQVVLSNRNGVQTGMVVKR